MKTFQWLLLAFAVLSLTACSGDKGKNKTSLDTVPPIITIHGENPLILVFGHTYVEAGASAVDAIDGIVSVTTNGTVDTGVLGNYSVAYTASDKAGNTKKRVRIVKVVSLTIPEINIIEDLSTVNGNNVEIVNVLSSYQFGEGISGTFIWNKTIKKSDADYGLIYDPTKSFLEQGTGSGSGVWVRQFNGKARLKWWGALPGIYHIANTTKSFLLAQTYKGNIELTNKGEYFIGMDSPLILDWHSLNANGSTISLYNSIEGNGIIFSNISKIENTIFDGNENYFTSGRDSYLVKIESDEISILNTTFQNIIGTNRDQYALGINWNTKSLVDNSVFKNISTHTNDKNTGGFTGGILITDDNSYRKEKTKLLQSTHIIRNSKFNDIFTRPQLHGGMLYSDSDGIRNYAYGLASYTGEEYENLKNTQFIIENCDFKNVLKSGLKLNYSHITVKKSTFIVDDLHYQDPSICTGGHCDSVYTGYRFQTGEPTVTLEDITITGKSIRFGIIYLGNQTLSVDNMYYHSTFESGYATLLGSPRFEDINSYSRQINIENLTSNKSIGVISNIDNIEFKNIDNQNNVNSIAFRFIGSYNSEDHTINRITIEDSEVKGGVVLYQNTVKPKIKEINIINTIGISEEDIAKHNNY